VQLEFLRDLVEWTAAWAHSPYGGAALFAIAFAESSFFPIPPDVLLIPLALARTAQALLFAAIATAGSMLGGIFGFIIGDKGGRPLLRRFFKREKVDMVQYYYRRYDVWAVGMAGFTPIPYKLFSISAGAFGLDFKRFLLASVVGRGARFFLVGLVIALFGEPVKALLDTYFEVAVVTFAVLLIGGIYIVNLLARRSTGRQAPNSQSGSGEPSGDASGVLNEEMKRQ
jgi:membrane protein YqaA with SNARE-associated domain